MTRPSHEPESGGGRPYPQLDWILATGFRHLREGRWLPVAVEYDLKAAPSPEASLPWFADLNWLDPDLRDGVNVPLIFKSPPNVLVEKPFPFCTLLVDRKFLSQIVLDPGWRQTILQAEVGPPLSDELAKALTQASTVATPGSLKPPPSPKSLLCPLLKVLQQSVAANPAAPGLPAAVLTAVLDEGIAFAHERFRVGNQTRIVSFWNQDGHAGPPPPEIPFGTELFANDIDQAVNAAGPEEDTIYRTIGELSFADPDYKAIAHRRSHGTHVLDLAAGDDPATAPLARPIIAIQMPELAIADTSDTTLTPYKLLGFIYTLLRAQQLSALLAGNVPVVVSLSYGTYDGPHDGSGFLENMIDQLTFLCAGSATPTRFVIAAGNHRQARVRAQFGIAHRRPKTLHWRLQPDDRAPNLLQIWLPKSGAGLNQCQVHITVTSPTGASISVDPTNLSAQSPGLPPVEFAASYVPETPTQRARIEIRTEPTAPAIPLDRSQPTVTPGVWLVNVSHVAGGPFVCDAYIQRNDTLIGRRAMGRQSYFDESSYARHERIEIPGNRSGRPKEFDRPPPASDVTRTGTLNGDGTGTESYVIGGYRRTPKHWNPLLPAPGNPMPAAFTSEGPPAANAPRTMPSPNWLMPSDDALSCRGVLAAGTRSGVRVAMGGTSVAAPQAARYVADQLAIGNVPGMAPPPGLFPVSDKVPPGDRPLVGGWGCMDFPRSQTRGRP